MQPNSLLTFKSDIYSQRGDDGIIREVFRRLNVPKGFFIEFGGWDGIYFSNARLLFEESWSGMFIERRHNPQHDSPSENDPADSSKVRSCTDVKSGCHMKVIFSAQSDFFSEIFLKLCKTVPSVNPAFVGTYWANGSPIRRAGYRYVHLPLWSRTSVPATSPRIAELITGGYSITRAPASIRRATAVTSDVIRRLFKEIAPDLIICSNAEDTVAFLLDQVAQETGIPSLCLQRSFLSDAFIIHRHGRGWIREIATASLPDRAQPLEHCKRDGVPQSQLRRIDGRAAGRSRTAHASAVLERIVRVAICGVTFDTPWSVVRGAYKILRKPIWLPDSATLERTDEIPQRFILVVLNDPIIYTDLRIPDLITFALEACPPGMSIVIRPHPTERAKSMPLTLRRKLRGGNVWISRNGRGPRLEELLKQCRAVLTMNSAVGLEGLLCGTPVFTMAPAIYARPGLATPTSAESAGIIRKSLELDSCPTPVRPKVRQFCDYLVSDRSASVPQLAEMLQLLAVKEQKTSKVRPCVR